MSMQGVPGRRPTARGRTPRQATQPPHIYSRILGRRNVYGERPGSTVPSKSPHGGGRTRAAERPSRPGEAEPGGAGGDRYPSGPSFEGFQLVSTFLMT